MAQHPPPYGQGVQMGDIQPYVVTNQPQTTTTTVVVNNNQATGPGNLPGGAPQNYRDWDTGLCGCCEDIGSCCFGYFCGWCMACSISSQMGEHCCLACINPPGFAYGARVKLRAMYGIQGSMCNDACCSSWCFHLTLCQLQRQINKFKESHGQMAVTVHTK